MTVTERFASAWSDYQSLLLEHDVFIPLSQYCRKHSLSYSYMGNWLSEHGLSCNELRAQFKKRQQSKVTIPSASTIASGSPASGFITIPASCLSRESSPSHSGGCVIKGVSVTFPDGVQVSIREIYQRDLNNFINEYNHQVEEEQPCLH